MADQFGEKQDNIPFSGVFSEWNFDNRATSARLGGNSAFSRSLAEIHPDLLGVRNRRLPALT